MPMWRDCIIFNSDCEVDEIKYASIDNKEVKNFLPLPNYQKLEGESFFLQYRAELKKKWTFFRNKIKKNSKILSKKYKLVLGSLKPKTKIEGRLYWKL